MSNKLKEKFVRELFDKIGNDFNYVDGDTVDDFIRACEKHGYMESPSDEEKNEVFFEVFFMEKREDLKKIKLDPSLRGYFILIDKELISRKSMKISSFELLGILDHACSEIRIQATNSNNIERTTIKEEE